MSLKIGLIDVDGHNFPNLAQMKLSAYYKARGCLVEVASPRGEYDVVYMSKVFDSTYSPDLAWEPHADDIVRGGTGYGLDNKLSYEVEHTYPDYELYPGLTENTAFGFLTRGCPRGCSFCIVSEKEGQAAVKAADLDEFWRGQKFVKLLDANILACKDAHELLGQLIESKAYIDFTQGLDIRLMSNDYVQLINRMKLKSIHFAWDDPRHDLTESFRGYAAKAKHKLHGDWGSVYVLCNFNTTFDEDMWRIETLISLGYSPYVMIYDKPSAPKITRHLQRWCNAPPLRKSCTFAEYLKTKRYTGEETMT